ncbi:MAG: OB-fold domain-containing protein, partial [Mycobacteriaceae bacterium]
MSTAEKPFPEPTPVTKPFWDSLREHRIEIQYSPSSDEYVFYPRVLAPRTLADDLEWREITGLGTLYTYTVADRPTAPPWADSLPQILAVVQWDVGPRLSTEMV